MTRLNKCGFRSLYVCHFQGNYKEIERVRQASQLRYILTQTEDIPQKHITSIRKEIDYQKRNLLLRYI